jgi:hypothetical protein
VEQDVAAAGAPRDAQERSGLASQFALDGGPDHGARPRFGLRRPREARLVLRPVGGVHHVPREQHHACGGLARSGARAGCRREAGLRVGNQLQAFLLPAEGRGLEGQQPQVAVCATVQRGGNFVAEADRQPDQRVAFHGRLRPR